jgi:hypothetical protein
VSSYQHSHSENCQRKIASQHFEQNCTRIKALYCCYPLEHGSRRKYEGCGEYEHRINGVAANHVCANQPDRAYVLHILRQCRQATSTPCVPALLRGTRSVRWTAALRIAGSTAEWRPS